MQKVNLAEKFSKFSDHWSPKKIGAVDNYDIKLVKLLGDFVWHKHDDEDEMFFVVNGNLSIEFRDKTVNLSSGEMIVVPKGTEHRPFAENECEIMLFEKQGVLNTGDAEQGDLTATKVESI